MATNKSDPTSAMFDGCIRRPAYFNEGPQEGTVDAHLGALARKSEELRLSARLPGRKKWKRDETGRRPSPGPQSPPSP